MKVSMHNWMRPEPIETTIARLGKSGYDGIEISGEPALYDADDVKRLMDQHGVECWGSVTLMTGGRDLVHDAEAKRFLGPADAPAQDEVDRAARAEQPRQPLRTAAAGQDAERDLGQTDAVVSRLRDADVARERELEAAAHRVAVHGGDHRLRQGAQVVEHPVVAGGQTDPDDAQRLAVARVRGELLDAVVRDELSGHAAREDHDAHVAAPPLLDQPGVVEHLRELPVPRA